MRNQQTTGRNGGLRRLEGNQDESEGDNQSRQKLHEALPPLSQHPLIYVHPLVLVICAEYTWPRAAASVSKTCDRGVHGSHSRHARPKPTKIGSRARSTALTCALHRSDLLQVRKIIALGYARLHARSCAAVADPYGTYFPAPCRLEGARRETSFWDRPPPPECRPSFNSLQKTRHVS